MLKDDFYADPTVFDQWQYETGSWCCSRVEMLRPYAWLAIFALLALVFLLIGLGVCLTALQQGMATEAAPAWNQLLARGVTALLALAAAQSLFRQAVHAWPEYIQLPVAMQRLIRFFAVRQVPAQAAIPASVQAAPRKAPVAAAANRQAVQEFFSGVRAAGINVTIAKALFAAGVRSVHHLSRAPDHYLHSIHGVGPATVRKLRAYFEQQQLQSVSCASSAR